MHTAVRVQITEIQKTEKLHKNSFLSPQKCASRKLLTPFWSILATAKSTSNATTALHSQELAVRARLLMRTRKNATLRMLCPVEPIMKAIRINTEKETGNPEKALFFFSFHQSSGCFMNYRYSISSSIKISNASRKSKSFLQVRLLFEEIVSILILNFLATLTIARSVSCTVTWYHPVFIWC